MTGLLIASVIVLLALLYVADRMFKAWVRGRRLRAMNDRLAAATARAEALEEKRAAVARASAELTSVMPAIHHPVLTPDKAPAQEEADGATSTGADGSASTGTDASTRADTSTGADASTGADTSTEVDASTG